MILTFTLRMTGAVQSPYTHEQIATWIKGLLALAWADGHFDDEEKALIASLTEIDLISQDTLDGTLIITPEELAAGLGSEPHTAENFMRTAVMVAIADGTYSTSEDALLRHYCSALDIQTTVLDSLRQTIVTPHPSTASASSNAISSSASAANFVHIDEHHLPVLSPVQDWLDHLEIHDPKLARFLCKMIPPQCPFERDVMLFGRKIVHIPPMCKLNPLYEQLVGLRFRALSYLADDCGEDVTQYC